jgi:hypothetical protein
MLKRLLIVARDFVSAQHWAKKEGLSPGRWVYISSYHNIQGNAESEYVKLPGWDLRPDALLLEEQLAEYKCVKKDQAFSD